MEPSSLPPEAAAVAEAVPNFHQVNAHVYRSGRPDEAGVKAYAAFGIKTILSVQDYGLSPEEAATERKWAEAAGIRFLHVPMHGLRKPRVEQIRAALAHLQNPANFPILVHCQKGSDRTGIVVASYRIAVDNWPVERAKDDMYNFGHSYLLSWWDSILDEIQSL
jgi:uncharacterized protein (TIGR01244 family)